MSTTDGGYGHKMTAAKKGAAYRPNRTRSTQTTEEAHLNTVQQPEAHLLIYNGSHNQTNCRWTLGKTGCGLNYNQSKHADFFNIQCYEISCNTIDIKPPCICRCPGSIMNQIEGIDFCTSYTNVSIASTLSIFIRTYF